MLPPFTTTEDRWAAVLMLFIFVLLTLAVSSQTGLSLYDFLKDQGGIVSGLLALLAGALAYRAGRRQAIASEKQSTFLIRSERRHLATENMLAARLMDGILCVMEDNMEGCKKIVGTIEEVKESIDSAPFIHIQASLGRMSGKFIADYTDLFTLIEQTKSRFGPSSFEELTSNTEKISKMIRSLKMKTSDQAEKWHHALSHQLKDS